MIWTTTKICSIRKILSIRGEDLSKNSEEEGVKGVLLQNKNKN